MLAITMADPIAVFGCNRRWEPTGYRPCAVFHPKTSSLDLSWVASITSTTREGRETGRCACLLGNAGRDLRLSTIRPRSFAGQIPARFGLKMAPPAAVTKIHWSHFRLKQSSIGIIAANNERQWVPSGKGDPLSIANWAPKEVRVGVLCSSKYN